MRKQHSEFEIAEKAFAQIANCFPSLEMTRHPDDPVEVSIRLPVQAGLKHPVWLALQNSDELHFAVSHFWLEWFPCTNPSKFAAYVAAVCGFLSGKYRVVEYVRNGECYKAVLQSPSADGWSTVGTWSKLHLPLPWGTTSRVVSNA